MKVTFWGVKGSLGAPLSNRELSIKIEIALKQCVRQGIQKEADIAELIKTLPWHVRHTAGGNTSCVQIETGDNLIIMDAGTGIRPLGIHLMQKYATGNIRGHIFLSHLHWDHICGIPLFTPAYNSKNDFCLYSSHSHFENAIREQQNFTHFPVPIGAAMRFQQLNPPQEFQIDDILMETIPLNHPGTSYGYRLTHEGRTVVYATDSEYKDVSSGGSKPYIDFFSQADLLIFDAQYSMMQNVEKEDWGHSNAFTGIDMALAAGVKTIAFTHHEPAHDDEQLWSLLERAKAYLEMMESRQTLNLQLAYEGLEFSI